MGDGSVATYLDEDGVPRVAMAKIEVVSGRTTSGPLIAQTLCGSLGSEGGLQQGEDRSTNLMTGLGDIFRSILGVFGM